MSRPVRRRLCWAVVFLLIAIVDLWTALLADMPPVGVAWQGTSAGAALLVASALLGEARGLLLAAKWAA